MPFSLPLAARKPSSFLYHSEDRSILLLCQDSLVQNPTLSDNKNNDFADSWRSFDDIPRSLCKTHEMSSS